MGPFLKMDVRKYGSALGFVGGFLLSFCSGVGAAGLELLLAGARPWNAEFVAFLSA